MKATSLAILVIGISGGIFALTARAQTAVQVNHVREMSYRLHLGPPDKPPSLSSTAALHVAETSFAPGMFQTHPYTERYGSYHSNMELRDPQGLVPVGTIDVWAITVTGLNMDRPAAEIAEPDGSFMVQVPPPIHTEVILIDDKHRRFLEAIGY